MADRLAAVKAAIGEACHAVGRDPESVTLVGVSKLFPAEYAIQAVQLGLSDLGENRVQEMLDKQDELSAAGLNPRWHLIGSLQRRKVRQIIGRTVLIHSVDSIRLAEEISERSQQMNTITHILLQVNSSLEDSKHGFQPDNTLLADAEKVAMMPGVSLNGLMTMAQLTENADETLPVFDRTRNLFELIKVQLSLPDWQILSMGMSQDFRQAIACGSTHVRIGSAIFGSRNSQT